MLNKLRDFSRKLALSTFQHEFEHWQRSFDVKYTNKNVKNNMYGLHLGAFRLSMVAIFGLNDRIGNISYYDSTDVFWVIVRRNLYAMIVEVQQVAWVAFVNPMLRGLQAERSRLFIRLNKRRIGFQPWRNVQIQHCQDSGIRYLPASGTVEIKLNSNANLLGTCIIELQSWKEVANGVSGSQPLFQRPTFDIVSCNLLPSTETVSEPLLEIDVNTIESSSTFVLMKRTDYTSLHSPTAYCYRKSTHEHRALVVRSNRSLCCFTS
ncbi:hypothetical protein ANN_06672 [Periplaneta americana]|uniref:Uncharacterized protein n=1 Tax=Periplaneta americana TaxID=6978 RepID=A0ABQ8TG81_PERAM|nr:hypothetical protein ANN_06672 [Periplaneta americana]